ADRIESHGYPSEVHKVTTPDGYVLTLFRIPHSPRLENQNATKRVFFLLHGVLSSSDCWILNGPNDALAFLLADAGYDVWLGNARGNVYSRNNIYLNPSQRSFWAFSWHEIAVLDSPAMIDYVLNVTGETSLHYVGHSQGTTTLFALLSSKPEYNAKFRTTHMLAPVCFMEHARCPLILLAAPLFGTPTTLSTLSSDSEFLPNEELLSQLRSAACSPDVVDEICSFVLFLFLGYDPKHLNYTLMPDVYATQPAGCSTRQLLHYAQMYKSGHFRNYDYGAEQNLQNYGQLTPPDYNLSNIHPEVPVKFYYSDNDLLANVTDVMRLANSLGNNVELHHVKYPEYNHIDCLLALEVKVELYVPIIKRANDYENKFI
ncbi:PREDICTED: lipase 3-like, partial [Rhagoletis zephyria]|uniref:lipase 3-like n=1 Tax=Rhagoletis zephyria TaxID=28612 RepID=UPI0008115F1A